VSDAESTTSEVAGQNAAGGDETAGSNANDDDALTRRIEGNPA
jgi:hypothetical protein